MPTEAELLPPSIGAAYKRSPKVLVVDANIRHCMLYRMEMEAHGYQVVCAHNGHEALEQLQYRRFDVVVVDVILPDISGVDLIKQISTNPAKRNGHRLPIIINTAFPYSQQQKRRWSADAFILKSSNLDELIGKVTSFLRRKRSQVSKNLLRR
jgi:DNA-binding response OmpR family regulator